MKGDTTGRERGDFKSNDILDSPVCAPEEHHVYSLLGPKKWRSSGAQCTCNETAGCTCRSLRSDDGFYGSDLLCTKSNAPTVQYRERSDRMAHSTNQPSEFRRMSCVPSGRSRHCTDRSTLTKIRVFVQSHSELSTCCSSGAETGESNM